MVCHSKEEDRLSMFEKKRIFVRKSDEEIGGRENCVKISFIKIFTPNQILLESSTQ
jgi:hypothetical protein